MDFSEKWGTNVDEAVRLALIDLKLTIDEVEVIILEEPSKGFFGIGSKLAKVRVEKRTSKKEKPNETSKGESIKKETLKKETSKPIIESSTSTNNYKKLERSEVSERFGGAEISERSESSEKRGRKERDRKSEKVTQDRPSGLQTIEQHTAITFLKDITSKMGLDLEIKMVGNEDVIYIDMVGKDSGTVIGKRGQTLDSIQYLTSLVVNKDREKYLRVVVDVESYRAKREKTLEHLANRLSDKVIRTKKSVRLEPMNPYERKVIHATLQNNPQVTTRSEGEEPYRRVIIELK